MYDQAKSKKIVFLDNNPMEKGEVSNVYYIYTQEQYL